MRDEGFKTIHRGGTLTPEDHRALMGWAIVCTEHILNHAPQQLPHEVSHALAVARLWRGGKVSTGTAISASRTVHALAKEMTDPVMHYIARAIGHAVATAHMADHCLGPAWYAKKVIKLTGGSVEEEHAWQLQQLTLLKPHLQALITQSPKFR